MTSKKTEQEIEQKMEKTCETVGSVLYALGTAFFVVPMVMAHAEGTWNDSAPVWVFIVAFCLLGLGGLFLLFTDRYASKIGWISCGLAVGMILLIICRAYFAGTLEGSTSAFDIVPALSFLGVGALILYARDNFFQGEQEASQNGNVVAATSPVTESKVDVPISIKETEELLAEVEFHDSNEKAASGTSPVPKSREDVSFSIKETERLLAEVEFHDRMESRTPEEFDHLRQVMTTAAEDARESLRLCLIQIDETPDYDMPYMWASNFQNSKGDTVTSLATLTRGLQDCKRVSGILDRLGVRFLDIENPVLAAVSFSKAILAQEPSRSDHDPYLYFSYICRFSDFGNAAEKALAIARNIYGAPIDLTLDEQNGVKSIVSSNIEFVQPLVRILIGDMMREDRID